MKSFDEVNRYIDDFVAPLDSSSSYSLDRIEGLLEFLGNPQEKFKTIHIAGTSGKTSTAYYAANMLQAAGYKTGLTVSPHIEKINERVQIDLSPLPERLFVLAFKEFVNKLNTLSIRPTYFELMIAFAFWYFAKAKVDYAVVEVGLGGLLDATNTINRQDKVCIITDIGLDHTQVLGRKLEEIATQKAGIIRHGNTVFINRQDENVLEVVKNTAVKKSAALQIIDPNSKKLPKSLAEFQKRNWCLAKEVSEFIFKRDKHETLSDEEWESTTQALIPGRIEIIKFKGKTIVLDGAHNSQKMRSFTESFRSKFPRVKPAAIVAIAESKDLHLTDIADELNRLCGMIILTSFESNQDSSIKSIPPEKIAGYLDEEKVIIEKDVKKAVNILLARQEDILLITGSLYLIRSARDALEIRT